MQRIIVPVVAVLMVAAAYAVAAFGHQIAVGKGSRLPLAQSAGVTTVVRACPSPGLAGQAQQVALTAAATGGTGRAQVIRLGAGGGAPLASFTQPGRLSVVKVPAASTHRTAARSAAASPSPSPPGRQIPAVSTPGGVMVQASGVMARGLEVEQVTGGVTSAQCISPGTDFWFAGPGQHTARRIELFLMNTSGLTADVNVDAATDAGPVEGSTDAGVSVPPHSMVMQSLAGMMRGSRVIALEVRTSGGQVAAAVRESKNATGGWGWLPATQSPATTVVLPGLPGTPGPRQLFVMVPGSQDAHIKLTAVTSRGSYQPIGGDGLDIPGGAAVSIGLSSLAGIPAAVKLSASVPVTATMMLAGGPPGSPGAFATASPAIQQQGVVAENESGAGENSELVLSAPGQAVHARITELGTGGTGAATAPQVVQVKAGHSLVVQLGPSAGSRHRSAFGVVVTPLAGSGPLYAGRVMADSGAVQSVLPVGSALTSVPLPAVRDEFLSTRG